MGAFLAVHDYARRTTAVRHDHTDRAVVLADIDALDVDFVEYRLGRGRIGASFGHDGQGESGGLDAGIQDEQLVDFHGMSPLAGARTRSEEPTSDIQYIIRTSSAALCSIKKLNTHI